MHWISKYRPFLYCNLQFVSDTIPMFYPISMIRAPLADTIPLKQANSRMTPNERKKQSIHLLIRNPFGYYNNVDIQTNIFTNKSSRLGDCKSKCIRLVVSTCL